MTESVSGAGSCADDPNNGEARVPGQAESLPGGGESGTRASLQTAGSGSGINGVGPVEGNPGPQPVSTAPSEVASVYIDTYVVGIHDGMVEVTATLYSDGSIAFDDSVADLEAALEKASGYFLALEEPQIWACDTCGKLFDEDGGRVEDLSSNAECDACFDKVLAFQLGRVRKGGA